MRSPNGFTLIELMIVAVILGVLAAVAIPRFSGRNQKAFDAAAKNDLRNAMIAEEAFFDDCGPGSRRGRCRQSYTGVGNLMLTTSAGVRVRGGGSAGGYSLSARHASSPNTWAVTVGSGTSVDGKIVKR
ncbi:MAG TPA: prepilin-type N-terminal cleavage/methylation domain-containing protein [Gemmatimonadota bacterium]|jgi:prepilin-type N-terminal cleavage/methylation domain-containing protein